ncbi:MAG TPA: WYL domain-containing protein [Gemmatimonadales bacterium]
MSDTASAQLRRVLQVIPELGDGEPHPIAELVQRAGVDRATLVKDLRTITDRRDAPGGFVEGLQIYLGPDEVSITPSHFLRPMRLTRPELCALELGLAMLRGSRPAEEHRAIDRARARLRKAISITPPADGEELRAAALAPAGDPEHLRRLREALRNRRQVRLSYRKAGAESASERLLCPYGIVFTSGMWYVVANCGEDDVRIFRLDRVEGVQVLATTYERPKEFSLDDVVREGRAFQGAGLGTLRVRYSPRIARWIAEREGKELAPDGSLVLEHPLADVDWAVRHVLQYGPDAEALEPPEVRRAIVERLER